MDPSDPPEPSAPVPGTSRVGAPAQGFAPEVERRDAASDLVLVCEHASRRVPERWRGLGLSERDARSHAAWDPGAQALARALSARLDAPAVISTVSRLVHDANRPAGDPSAMPARVELVDVPGNAALPDDEVRARTALVHAPFHTTLAALLDWREAEGLPTCLVTVHSFNPTWHGEPREVGLGVLHDEDARLADALLGALGEADASGVAGGLAGVAVRRNEPYGPEDGVTFTLVEHALERGLPNVMLELRADLLCDAAGVLDAAVADVAAALAPALVRAATDVLGPLARTNRAGMRVGAD